MGPARLILSLLLVLTAFGQALAEGRMAGSQAVEVCTETGARTITLDARGKPVESEHRCLACLLPVFAAAPAADGPSAPTSRSVRPGDRAGAARADSDVPAPQARAPPQTV